jgi:predicted phosphodiesterase
MCIVLPDPGAMKLLIISDLHLCNGSRFGAFKWNQREFIDMLDTLISAHSIDKVVLNGDVYELCTYSFDQIAATHAALLDYFDRIKPIYIRGNHDIANEKAYDHYLIVNDKGEKIYIEHGHKADFLNGTSLGRLISRTLLKLLKGAGKARWIRELYFDYLRKDAGFTEFRKYHSHKYLSHAMRLLKRYDVVILGHTHKMEAHNSFYYNHKKQYLNSGTCSLGRFQGIVLDTETLLHTALSFQPRSRRIPQPLPALIPEVA